MPTEFDLRDCSASDDAPAPMAERAARADFADPDLLKAVQPTVLRGFTAHWPVVAAAREGPAELIDYLRRFDSGVPVEAFVGEQEMQGRYFYNLDLSGFNFRKGTVPLGALLDLMLSGAAGAPPVYAGSQFVRRLLPGFEAENSMPLLAGKATEPRIWIGNGSRVAPHFDESNNIAVVAAGRRRFTIFPPDQVKNLYIGPLDFTVAGQPASMVDLAAPDLERFPKSAEALRHAFVAELEPGDAIYIPALWWHGIEAEGSINVLVNYWWQDVPSDSTSAFAAMAHGILALRELPYETRQAWRSYFDYFAFQIDGDPAGHLPLGRRGILDTPTPALRARMREFLARVLSKN